MKVNLDFWHLLHLVVLVLLTYGFGLYLAQEWDMSRLSAYGVSCFGVCQCSNVLLKLFAAAPTGVQQQPAAIAEKSVPKQKKKRK
jgi:hypothetical protein